jgi:hypothetical protein
MQKQAKARSNALLDTFTPRPSSGGRAAKNPRSLDKGFRATRACDTASGLHPGLATQSSTRDTHATAAKTVPSIPKGTRA